jgi:hypothetical protein
MWHQPDLVLSNLSGHTNDAPISWWWEYWLYLLSSAWYRWWYMECHLCKQSYEHHVNEEIEWGERDIIGPQVEVREVRVRMKSSCESKARCNDMGSKGDYNWVVVSGTHFKYAWLTLLQSNTVQKCFNHSSFPQTPYPALIQARSCTLMQKRGNRVSPSVVKSNPVPAR